jgi:hypothetical protein
MSKRDLERFTDARLNTQPELEPPQPDGLGLDIAPYFLIPTKKRRRRYGW